MNTYQVRIKMDNAAFDGAEGPHEVARILRNLADRIVRHSDLENVGLTDINGHTVGRAYICG